MEQHPVPQNISSYQFHLVGDMTLKQFLELAAGVVVGVLFYASGLPNIIKWPLILISAGLGAALAFVPLEERPLEQWIVAFFRSVYSPTLFHWEKRQGVKYFSDETPATQAVGAGPATTTSTSKLDKLDEKESSYLSKLTNLFNFGPGLGTPVATPASSTVPGNPPSTTAAPVFNPSTGTGGAVGIQHTMTLGTDSGQILTAHMQNTNPAQGSNGFSPTAGSRTVSIPTTNLISLDKSARPQMVVEETPATHVAADATKTSPVQEVLMGKATPTGVAAVFSPDAAPPSLPTITNTVSGQVMGANKKIIEGAILEIVDEAGRIVRALKTNKAGHFLTVTALMDGKYKIIVDHEGYTFDPVEFEAKGAIIEPIAIKAK